MAAHGSCSAHPAPPTGSITWPVPMIRHVPSSTVLSSRVTRSARLSIRSWRPSERCASRSASRNSSPNMSSAWRDSDESWRTTFERVPLVTASSSPGRVVSAGSVPRHTAVGSTRRFWSGIALRSMARTERMAGQSEVVSAYLTAPVLGQLKVHFF